MKKTGSAAGSEDKTFRKSTQYILPGRKPAAEPGRYDIYPSFSVGDNKIYRGLADLAALIAGEELVLLDGYHGIFFSQIKDELDYYLVNLYGKEPLWICTEEFLLSPGEINSLTAPFTGGSDPLFGTRSTLTLADYFKTTTGIVELADPSAAPLIIYGAGAALFSEAGFLVYFDLPKNELQYRARAGTVNNIGLAPPGDPKEIYKRFYFADWVALNRHKESVLNRIDVLADGQRPEDITWLPGTVFRSSLKAMCSAVLRARPWFEPGTWGGKWILENVHGLNKEARNYAWSFELITPENGLILESSGLLLEFSFDFLMYAHAREVLGLAWERFGTHFPIRFDFLDTFSGGNLSIQCHPRPGYMKKNFGEDFTQEETYYILDAAEDASVYLGFRDDIDPENFRKELVKSFEENTPVEIERFVMKHHSAKHDLFLIPYGTIHGSGINNLVLEISSTPYIFTFKMYDWLRPDLDGKPRPLNIDRGMENLYFDRKGDKVLSELISQPELIEEGTGWQRFRLPTHETHLYDVERYHFTRSYETITNGKCLVLSLVEGTSVKVSSRGGFEQVVNYAETFVIPASAGSAVFENLSDAPVMIVAAYVK